jgi:hypothetical protein
MGSVAPRARRFLRSRGARLILPDSFISRGILSLRERLGEARSRILVSFVPGSIPSSPGNPVLGRRSSLRALRVHCGIDPLDARRILAGAFASVALIVPWISRDVLARCGVVLASFLLFSPTVHPWYALFLVPFLVFLPRWLRASAFVLIALLPASYAALWMHPGMSVEPAWIRLVTWVPTLSILLWEGGKRALRGRW